MRKIVLASNNRGKLREMRDVLSGLDVELVAQAELGVTDADETGLSFLENALIKARHASSLTGLPAIADDSGIEVDALGGAPGIYSARYAGIEAGDEANNAKLLAELAETPDDERTARFHCVLVYLRSARDPMPQVYFGTWEGRILREAHGRNGFGYDPLFFVPTHGCASAELPPETKNALSHRGQALRSLASCWKP